MGTSIGVFRIKINDDKVISNMKNIDYLALDGRSLKTFLTVLEESSVSAAANRLGVTQSAVSHTLDKLRVALGDPLFVRSGRGIEPTLRAQALRDPVRALLDDLKGLTNERVFDPSIGHLDFTIAANDFQRDLIFPTLLRDIQADSIDARFQFIASGLPSTKLLLESRCQLIITPRPPDGEDIYQTRLFDDNLVCFYDAGARSAPSTKADFTAADHIEVRFEEGESRLSSQSEAPGLPRKKPGIMVTNFAAVASFLKGSTRIAIQPALMSKVLLDGFSHVNLPFKSDPLVFYMVWHKRDHHDPAHQWLRQRVKRAVEQVVPAR